MEVLNAEYPCGDTLGSIAPDVNDFIIIIVVINICLMLIFSLLKIGRSLIVMLLFVLFCFVLSACNFFI